MLAPLSYGVRFLGAVYAIPHPLRPAQALQFLALRWRHAQAYGHGFLASFHWRATLAPSGAALLCAYHFSSARACNRHRSSRLMSFAFQPSCPLPV